MTRGLCSGKRFERCLCVILSESSGEKVAVFTLCADNPAQTFQKMVFM